MCKKTGWNCNSDREQGLKCKFTLLEMSFTQTQGLDCNFATFRGLGVRI
jgi:hypothetical protein